MKKNVHSLCCKPCFLAISLDERPLDSLCELSEVGQEICALSAKERGPVISKDILAKHWGIGLDTVHWTPTAMTESGIRRILQPVEACYKTHQSHLHFPMLNKWYVYTDTMFSTIKSLHDGNNFAQVFTNGLGYDLFYPLKKELEVADALNKFI